MRFKFFLVLCLLLLIVKCSDDEEEIPNEISNLCDGDIESTDKNECFKLFNETLKKNYSCCYVEFKIKNDEAASGQECMALTKEQTGKLDEIKAAAKEENKDLDYEKLEIVCDSSSLLKLGLVSLFAALLI